MDLAALRRSHIAWAIAQNPTTITIQRTEKVRDGGGFAEKVSSIGPLTARLFQQRGQGVRDVAGLAGTKQEEQRWGLLILAESDLALTFGEAYVTEPQAGAAITDEFDVLNVGHFVVKAVVPQQVLGQVVGYQVDLEKVS